MPATAPSIARTRAIARVFGPFMAIAAASVAVRTADLGAILAGFFGNPALVFVTAAIMLACGLAIIAHHQYWSSAAAVAISLLGWYMALRAVALMVAPGLYRDASAAALTATPLVWAGCAVIGLIGLWLSWVGWIARRAGATRPA